LICCVADIAIAPSQVCDQKRFTISEVMSDCHELMIPQHILWSHIARATEHFLPTQQPADIPLPHSSPP